MAAADTIEVMNNLQFAQDSNTDIYTVHADGQAGESVVSVPVVLDPSVSGVKVIINNSYGATGSQVTARVRCTKVTGISTLTKTQNTQLQEWVNVVLGSIQETAEEDLSSAYEATLHIDCAITGTTAHLGTEIIVLVRKEATVDEWTVWSRFVVLNGLTAFKTDVLSTANAGQKVIPVNNPVTANLNHVNKFIFLQNATIANSEICYQTACGTD